MTATAARLYTPDMLALAVSLADFPLTDQHPLRAEDRSRTCGSSITLGLDVDNEGCVSSFGVQVSACAIGQASAAILAKSAKGATGYDIEAIKAGLNAWLAGQGDIPDWPGLELLEPARASTARHGAIMLPWNAASAALCKARDGR